MLLIALAAGIVAAALVFIAASSGGDDGSTKAVSGGDASSVLVAAQPIQAGTEITNEMVKLQSIPLDLQISGVYGDAEVVVGDHAKVAISQGEQITRAKIGLPVPDKGLAGVIPPGMRAVAIEVDEVTAAGGLLLPGDRIDVLAAYRLGRAAGLAEDEYILRTETMFQNVEVLSVAQEAQKPSAQSEPDENGDSSGSTTTSGQLPDDVEEQPDAKTITVAMSTADAQRIASLQTAENVEKVWAIQRAFGDNAIVEIPAYDIVIIKDQGGFNLDVPLP